MILPLARSAFADSQSATHCCWRLSAGGRKHAAATSLHASPHCAVSHAEALRRRPLAGHRQRTSDQPRAAASRQRTGSRVRHGAHRRPRIGRHSARNTGHRRFAGVWGLALRRPRADSLRTGICSRGRALRLRATCTRP
ncbi:hypothetical protein AXF42_Ash000002 [Apostasia shenzhenica]|uniref:Uncharacterized protein n=1 Tax=Apostasia shenzhenica TaxID=1088818 RepID=A0A2I0AF40_9ASPA|nr:hypothetical protein AXF42_Ash000002 [Apostasia shenzhenica]